MSIVNVLSWTLLEPECDEFLVPSVSPTLGLITDERELRQHDIQEDSHRSASGS